MIFLSPSRSNVSILKIQHDEFFPLLFSIYHTYANYTIWWLFNLLLIYLTTVHTFTTHFYTSLILSCHLWLGFTNCLFSLSFVIKIFCMHSHTSKVSEKIKLSSMLNKRSLYTMLKMSFKTFSKLSHLAKKKRKKAYNAKQRPQKFLNFSHVLIRG